VTGEPAAKPPAAWPARPVAGVILHFTSLPSSHGIGDIGDAALAFIDELAAMKLSVWQVLPTGPTAFGDSPYQPLSAFAGNELLIGLEPLMREGLVTVDEVAPLNALPASSVDYASVIPIKTALLGRAAERFFSARGPRSEAYRAFLDENDKAWLRDYALYRVLKSRHRERPWPQWDPAFAGRRAAEVRKFEASERQAIDRIKAAQFFFDQQWGSLRRYAKERGVRLFGDLPYYIALDSADAWARRDLLLLDESGRPTQCAGVPPDYFSEDGQLWGNPVYDWARHEETGFRWWIERLRRAARHCDMVRVDHFRGFESYWSVPAGETTARNGAWIPAPGDELFTAARKALGELPLLAEDLGVITEVVHRLRRRHGLPGMRVLQFELAEPDFDPAAIPEDCVICTATHDNDTTVGWFSSKAGTRGAKKEMRRARRNAVRLAGGRARTIHRDLIRLAFSTPARVALAPMQDYLGLGSNARLNTPGSAGGNWRWRLRPGQLSEKSLEEIAVLVEQSARNKS